MAAASQFYREVLGWEAKSLGQDIDSYTVLRHRGRPIAGIVYDERTSQDQSESQ